MSSYITKPSQGKAYSNNIRSVAAQNKDKIENEQLEELKEAFQLFDTNHSGSIDSREYKAAMRAFGFPIKKIDVARHFKSVGKEIEDSLTFDEFCRIVAPQMPQRDTKEEVYKLFQVFDEDNTGQISFKNLKKMCMEVGENYSD